MRHDTTRMRRVRRVRGRWAWLAVAVLIGGINVAAPGVVDAAPGGGLTPITPARLADSRPGQPTVDGQGAGGGPLGPEATRTVQVAGRAGIPAGAVGVVVNVTVTNPTAGSFLTVFPTGQARPNASNLNFAPGVTVANLVVTGLGDDGTITVFNNTGTVDVIVDATGWFATGAGLTPIAPSRLTDTRPGQSTVDGQANGTGPIGPGTTRTVQVAGRAGIPANAGAVVVNITATNPTESTFLTVWPTGQPRPNASNLNLPPGVTAANLTITGLGADGTITVFNNTGTIDVIIDATAWFATGSGLVPLTPARLQDTRPGQSTVDGMFNGTSAQGPGQTRTLQVSGRAGIPTGAATATLNITVTTPTDAGYLTIWPTGQPQPTALRHPRFGGRVGCGDYAASWLGCGWWRFS